MTNETNEQKIPYHECKLEEREHTAGVITHVCSVSGLTENECNSSKDQPLPPQEVEAKVVHEIVLEKFPDEINPLTILEQRPRNLRLLDQTQSNAFQDKHIISAMKKFGQKYHEWKLSLLRSYQGKVPSDVEILEYSTEYGLKEKSNPHDYQIAHMAGAKWMRSEVVPYIQRLEEELKAAKEALSELRFQNWFDYWKGHPDVGHDESEARKVYALLTPKKEEK